MVKLLDNCHLLQQGNGEIIYYEIEATHPPIVMQLQENGSASAHAVSLTIENPLRPDDTVTFGLVKRAIHGGLVMTQQSRYGS